VSVGLVLISHSAALAAGTIELITQMAPDVRVVAAGGTDDGRLGTSLTRVVTALNEAESGDGVVVVYDLGSALLTAELALESLEPDAISRVRIVHGPFVEGAVAAAVSAQGGHLLPVVARAASGEAAPARRRSSGINAMMTVHDPLGLHARPAAQLARAVAGLTADVAIGRPGGPSVDVTEILSVLSLALRNGEPVLLSAHGVQAQTALERVRELIEHPAEEE
jgi:dihydroxyacetone kinase phosphotransfer subunit